MGILLLGGCVVLLLAVCVAVSFVLVVVLFCAVISGLV